MIYKCVSSDLYSDMVIAVCFVYFCSTGLIDVYRHCMSRDVQKSMTTRVRMT